MNFARLFQLVYRHKWLLLAIVTVATTATYIGARMKGVVYQATATLMPQEQALQAVEDGGVTGDADQHRSNIQTKRARADSLVALAMSPKVLGPVLARLQAAGLPVGSLTPNDLQTMVQVEAVTPEVLRVSAQASTPEVAGEMANAVASTFVQFYGELSTNAVNESLKLLNQQERKAARELEQTRIAVQKYKAQHHIAALNDQLSGVLNRLNAVRQAREGTSAQLAELDAQLKELQAQLGKTPATVRVVEKSNDSPTAQQLRVQLGDLERDLALARGSYTELHPRVQELKAKLATTQRRLRQEEGRLIEHVRLVPNADYAALQTKRREMSQTRDGLVAKLIDYRKSVGQLENEMETYSGADVQLAAFMQRYSIAEQRFSSLTLRLRQAEYNADQIRSASAINLVDTSGPMNPPVDISVNKTRKLTMAAFVLSLALVIFILAAWDYLDRRVRTSADTEALMELPVAGIIPRSLPRAASTPLPQLTALMPVSPEGEAYRFLSLHLLLSRDDNPVRVLMMATAKPGQGATTTISNLATTLAQGNRRVILVDADLRRPMLHTVFETSNEVGLTSVLAEGLPVERALQSTAVPNLALLTAGPANDNPWSLLRSTSMEGLVRRLRQMADFVLIDTPSAAAFADAFNVAPLVDGAFMVVRSRHSPTGIEMKIKEMFEQAGVKVFGAILNDVPMNNVDSCRYHTQYYGKKRALGDGATPALPAART
jgi:polysaccharide biosynthesis transport protein